jgi:hypothetical protein
VKRIVWAGPAAADVRRLERPTAMRILRAVTRDGKNRGLGVRSYGLVKSRLRRHECCRSG